MTRQPLRAPAVVLLTVLLMGVGVTGAAALWSQQARVSATVTTGIWVEPTPPPGWRWDPQVEVVPGGVVSGNPAFTFTFSTVEGMEAAQYMFTVDKPGFVETGPQVTVAGGETSAWFRFRKGAANKPLTVTVTATVSGVESSPVTRTFTFSNDGSFTLQ